MYDLVMRVRDCDFSDAFDLVRKSVVNRFDDDDDDDNDEGLFTPYEPREIHQPGNTRPIMMGSECMRYLEKKRRVGWKEVLRYGLRDWPERCRVWVPLTRKNILISWVGRSYNDGKLKVRTPKGGSLGKRWAIFGLDQADKTDGRISLSEGWVDAVRLDQAGFVNPVAACGSMLTEEQVEDLSWVKHVLLFREGDVGGKIFEKSTRQWFGRRCTIDIVDHPVMKDPASYSVRGILRLCSPEQLKTFIGR